MKRAQALAADFTHAPSLAWSLLFAELAAAALLFFSGRVPEVLVRGLQLFLRF